jgi:hypothetical protein
MIDIGRIKDALASIARRALPYFEAYDAACNRLEVGSKELGAQGWPFSVTLSVEQVLGLAERAKETSPDEAFVAFYEAGDGYNTKQTFAMLATNSAMAKWGHLLRQVEAAMACQHDAICVPVLLTMVEGLVFPSPTTSTRVRTLVEEEVQRHPVDHFDRMVWNTIQQFVDEVYGNSDFTGTEPRLNRHWVLHGRTNANWTRTDCIRLLHAVRVLAEVRATDVS